jgi:hypothetical protein
VAAAQASVHAGLQSPLFWKEGAREVSVFKRGGVWWYKFRFCGQTIRESAKTSSKPLARQAERTRRKQLEEGYNGISRTDRAIIFENAAEAWLDSRKPHVAPKTLELYQFALSHLKTASAVFYFQASQPTI